MDRMDRDAIASYFEKQNFWPYLTREQQTLFLDQTRQADYGSGDAVLSERDNCLGAVFILKGILRISLLAEDGRQITIYRKTKPAHDGLKTAKKPERYREAFHADLTLYEAAVRYFRERGLKKLPAASRLQAENEALISEKNGLYTEYREQKARAAELQKVKSNLAAMLRQERTKEVRRDWER